MRSVSLLNDLEHAMYNGCIAAFVHIYMYTTLDSVYSRLNLSLVCSNARVFLARAGPCAKVSDLYLDG